MFYQLLVTFFYNMLSCTINSGYLVAHSHQRIHRRILEDTRVTWNIHHNLLAKTPASFLSLSLSLIRSFTLTLSLLRALTLKFKKTYVHYCTMSLYSPLERAVSLFEVDTRVSLFPGRMATSRLGSCINPKVVTFRWTDESNLPRRFRASSDARS